MVLPRWIVARHRAFPTFGISQVIAGVTVTFTVVSGPNKGITGTAVTNANGVAQFTYTGVNRGTDLIQASFVDAGGIARFSNDSSLPWSAMVCDTNSDSAINSVDIATVLAARGQKVKAGDTRDPNQDGVINVTDSRLCALKCTKPGCAK